MICVYGLYARPCFTPVTTVCRCVGSLRVVVVALAVERLSPIVSKEGTVDVVAARQRGSGPLLRHANGLDG